METKGSHGPLIVALIGGSALGNVFAADPEPLRNDLYHIRTQPDGSLQVADEGESTIANCEVEASVRTSDGSTRGFVRAGASRM